MTLIPGVIVYGLTVGSYYGLLAIGFTLIYATSRSMNFAHGEIYSLTSYVVLGALTVMARFGRPPLALTVGICVAVALLFGALLAVAVERIAFFPFKGRQNARLASILVTFGIAIIIDNALFLAFPHGSQTLPFAIDFPSGTVAGTFLSGGDVLLVGGAMVLLFGVDHFLRRTRTGKAMRGCAIDGEAASLMGVNVSRIIIATFLISGALAGFAAAGSTLTFAVLNPTMGSTATLSALVAAIAGGFGNIRGALLGGLILGFAEAIMNSYLASQWTGAMSFVVLVLVLLVRPQGLLGERSVAGRF